MQRHFVQELETLKTNLIKMSSFVETAIADSIRALLDRQKEAAERVVAEDERINALELEIDNAVVDLLALQQPVASDLRFILAAIKINNDLERIGDHAVNIAESAVEFAGQPAFDAGPDIPHMAEITKGMLRDAIDAFIHQNPELARKVLSNDDVIDDLNRKVIGDMVSLIRREPNEVQHALELTRVSRNLERVSDLATNIAEEVVFMADARVVKHHSERRRLPFKGE